MMPSLAGFRPLKRGLRLGLAPNLALRPGGPGDKLPARLFSTHFRSTTPTTPSRAERPSPAGPIPQHGGPAP